MKIPISSPSRTEKFPPPLMRFLRSNGGSRSRGRSRSSPMFVRKKNSIETQEPSSPKVTCMGQVRVRRSKQTTKKNGRTSSFSAKKRCSWFKKSLFCKCFSEKSNLESSNPVWRSWFSFPQNGYPKKVEIFEDFTEENSKSRTENEEQPQEKEEEEEVDSVEEEEDDDDEERENKGFVSSTPPKNALLLMRCRSDPYRNSSMLNRFWDSPSVNDQDPELKNRDLAQIENQDEQEEIEEKPKLDKPHISVLIPRSDPETDEKIGFFNGGSRSGRKRSTTKITEEEETLTVKEVIPLTLTRCKSEPAGRRKSMKMDSSDEICYWNKRKSGLDEQCKSKNNIIFL